MALWAGRKPINLLQRQLRMYDGPGVQYTIAMYRKQLLTSSTVSLPSIAVMANVTELSMLP